MFTLPDAQLINGTALMHCSAFLPPAFLTELASNWLGRVQTTASGEINTERREQEIVSPELDQRYRLIGMIL